MGYLRKKETSLDESALIFTASASPFLIFHVVTLCLAVFIHPAFLFGHLIPGIMPVGITVPYVYNEADEYLDSILYSYRKMKLSIKERGDDVLLHEKFPNIANWEEGDSLKGSYYKENGMKEKFGNKEFVSISGPKSIIVRRNSYHDKGYDEVHTNQIINLINNTFGHRENRKKDDRLREKAEETSSYEEFLETKEKALEDVRSVTFDEKEKLPNEIKS